MNLEPIACGTLRATDLGIAHLLGDFTSQLRGILVATHRRDVEPFVRLDQINRDARPCGIDHAKAETIFGIRRFGAPRRHFHACHFTSPFFLALPQGCLKAARQIVSLLPDLSRRAPRSSA
jgi:hypothetical protein